MHVKSSILIKECRKTANARTVESQHAFAVIRHHPPAACAAAHISFKHRLRVQIDEIGGGSLAVAAIAYFAGLCAVFIQLFHLATITSTRHIR